MRFLGVSFGIGNKKVGEVFNFSLPSKTSCPGASVWCLKHCYAHRYEKRRPTCKAAYEHNLALTQDIEKFTETMIGIVPRILPCFRIHISGDFYSKPYIEAWKHICESFPQTQFWAYTRSWNVPELVEPLVRLRDLRNVQLFASTDPTMPLPPKGWRIAFLNNDARAKGLACPQQEGALESCLSCGYCFRKKRGHVVFKIH